MGSLIFMREPFFPPVEVSFYPFLVYNFMIRFFYFESITCQSLIPSQNTLHNPPFVKHNINTLVFVLQSVLRKVTPKDASQISCWYLCCRVY